MTDQRAITSLAYLHTILDAGEKGYAVAALNLKNRGLKILFKAFAQQRARFKQEIKAELQRLGADVEPRTSFRGMVHRGRMNIFATLIIETEERENMVLSECLMGERIARRTYEKILKMDLPVETSRLVVRQYEQVCDVIEQVQLIRGKNEKRQVIFLYDSEKDVEKILHSLSKAGFPAESVERIKLADFAETYLSRGRPVQDCLISGAVGGVLWGSVIGSLAGLGAMQSSGMDPASILDPSTVWAMIAIAGILGGGLVGTVLGYFIGLGVSEEDVYQYQHSMEHGHAIIRILIDNSRAKEVGLILNQAQPEPITSG